MDNVDNQRLDMRQAITNFKKAGCVCVLMCLVIGTIVGITYAIHYVSPNHRKTDEPVASLARSIVDDVPLIGGYNDLPHSLYTSERNRINQFSLYRDLKADPKWETSRSSHIDINRLLNDTVGSQIFVAYVPCNTQYKDAVERTLEQIDVIKRMVAQFPQYTKYATSADDVKQIFKEKKFGSLITVEGGHTIDSRLAVLRMYYELGVRYMTLTHTCSTPWADASSVGAKSAAPDQKNLTEWGKIVIKEMNRLGMMIDISRVSLGVMVDVLEHSKAPVIFSAPLSHHLLPQHSNAQDDILKMLVKNKGIIRVNFFTMFIGGNNADKVVERLNYIRSVVGPDHIALGGDYDAVNSTPQGEEDKAKYRQLFEMLANGTYTNGTTFEVWTQEHLQNLAGHNLLRVFREVEKVRDIMTNISPYEDLIPYQEFVDAGVADQPCMTDMDIHKY